MIHAAILTTNARAAVLKNIDKLLLIFPPVKFFKMIYLNAICVE